MTDALVVGWIRNKFAQLFDHLDERGRRRWAATEALALGFGGIAAVAEATGLSDRTVRNGIKELEAQTPLTANRQRKPGGGRKAREVEQPTLVAQLESLIEPTTRGDPQSPLKWTCKSLPNLTDELQKRGFQVSHTKVAQLLKRAGYSLQGNRKTREGIRPSRPKCSI